MDAPARSSPQPPDADRTRDRRARMASRLRRLRRRFRMRHDELIATQQRLARAERAASLGLLVGQIAHEVGTPLHSIAGHLQLVLEDDALPHGIQDRLRIVAGEVQRLHHLIEGHLAALRPPAPAREPVILNRLIAETAALMRPLIDARRLRLELDSDPSMDHPVDCDPGQVRQALVNLVQNAIDASEEGGSILIRSAAAAQGVAISVCDSGAGLDPALAEHVFDPGFSEKGKGRGNGLGLSICREIARRHGGEVLFDSAPGEGTVVTLVLSRA